jgi:glycosyltransferase involved in cell wall biosynthesis
MDSKIAWVSFCISTYKRPVILQSQLQLLAQQTFSDFEVIVSDNDPDRSSQKVVEDLNDNRFRYFHNDGNLGMIKSFNKSIERSNGEFIVMVTDDDPVDIDFLETIFALYKKHPSYSIYCGFTRNGKKDLAVEIIDKDDFLIEILDPRRTSSFLWSSAVIRKAHAVKVGLIPDYGSPHLCDHAFIAMVGSMNGGVVINKMFSSLSQHDANFSKFNFQYYVQGCKGFYEFMHQAFGNHIKRKEYSNIVSKHLGKWFIACMFALKKYYTIANKKEVVDEVENCASEILKFPFMKKFGMRYLIKDQIFRIKKAFGLLK